MASKPSKNSRRARLLSIVRVYFDDAQQASSLLEDFLEQQTFSESLCVRLIEVARGSSDAAWDLRRLAVLMLEHQVLQIAPHTVTGFDSVLTALKLKPQRGPNVPLTSSLLQEGYTTTNLRKFIPELRRRLLKLHRVHAKIKGWRTSDEALREFLEASRSDCKLSLARYLFTAGEVAEKILGQLRITDGARDLDPFEASIVANEANHAFDALPHFEKTILKRLCASARIYWVSESIGSEINSLVEYPLTTVVVTIKPPGSDVEFEIKRAGCRGDRALNVVYARNGYTVSPSHRLDGGNMQWLLRHESRAAAKFSAVYRLVHDADPPLPSYMSRSIVYTIPVDGHEVQTLTYFTDARVFEGRFDEMRQAMAEVVAAFRAEGYIKLPVLPGDLGLTAQFISIVSPAQAILSGTTSYRLDRLASYFSDDGPALYFNGLQARSYSKDDARRFADALLEEILGTYAPPDVTYRSQEQYVAAALRVRANRRRADSTYLSLLQEIGTVWGTLLGVRGYSRGESFVARNVGLRSVWEDGEWKVKIIFMDHDAIGIIGPYDTDFYSDDALHGMLLDETYLWGRFSILGTVGHLRRIYQVSTAVYEQGQQAARASLKEAYQKTVRKLASDRKLRAMFHQDFVDRLKQWDELVGTFLRATSNGDANEDSREQLRNNLAEEQHAWFDSHIDAIERNRAFLERQSFLFV